MKLQDIDESRAPLLDHLIELRRRVLYCVLAVLAAFLVTFAFSATIYDWLAYPLRQTLGPDAKLISTEVTGQLWVRVEVALYAAMMIGFPFIANQAWAFIAPGMYRDEKKAFLPFLLMTPVLFSLGVSAAYVMMPVALKALLVGPFSLVEGNHALDLAVTPDVQKYLSFVRQLLFAFGFAFLMPVGVLLSNRAGLVSLETLQKGRRYAIVIAFALAAVLTPPDVTSQFLLAIPLIILYEFSLLFIRLFYKPVVKAAADAPEAAPQLPAPDSQ